MSDIVGPLVVVGGIVAAAVGVALLKNPPPQPECVSGDFSEPISCPDQLPHYQKQCVDGAWQPTEDTCTAVCHDGDFSEPLPCWDELPHYQKVCADGQWQNTGEYCPGECTNGEKLYPTTCWDGSVIYYQECVNGRWQFNSDQCPEQPPPPACPTAYLDWNNNWTRT